MSAADDPAEPPVAPGDVRAAVKLLQAALLAAGYYSGPVTGYWDRECESAIQVFQMARGRQ